MINLYVQHETARSEELAEQVQDILTQAIPAVEKVTGLPAPDPVTVELVDVEGLATAWSAFVRRQVERDTAGLDLTDWQRKRVSALPQAARWSARKIGMTTEYTLIANSTGRPSTLLIPEALEQQGLNAPDRLCELLVRALAEQTQVAACGGTIIPGPVWPTTRATRDVNTLFSHGHAQWTSDQATPLILGHPVVRDDHRRQRNFVKAVVDLLDFGTARQQARATSLVDQAIAAVGTDRFNHVWTVDGLLPALDELRQPVSWIRRLPA
ncbi:zinc-dependent metalloprotease [Streptomyces sp. NPDC002547]